MKGDFTRDSFDPSRDYLRVLLQQGRVSLDADWNEQIAILIHLLETLTRDLIGPYGGPEGACGFAIAADESGGLKFDFHIGTGRYYVDGLLVENHQERLSFARQASERGREPLRSGQPYLIYLDAWEAYVSPEEDPALREVALGGADTAGRSKVMWRVRAWEIDEKWANVLAPGEGKKGFTNDKIDAEWARIVAALQPEHRGQLRVRTADPAAIEDLPPAIVPPGSGYRGAENHLYRVEVHRSGEAAPADGRSSAGAATFKWSRDNASALFVVTDIAPPVLTLRDFGNDVRTGLAIGDWVELVSAAGSEDRPGKLFAVADVKPSARQVTLEVGADDALPATAVHLLLRHWDQKARSDRRAPPLHDGAVVIVQGDGDGNWLTLEDGIQIQFQKGDAHYRSGDYWLIPARTAEGGTVEWPRDDKRRPLARPPHGVTHRYAPLGVVSFNAAGRPEIECHSRIAFRMSLDRPSLTRA